MLLVYFYLFPTVYCSLLLLSSLFLILTGVLTRSDTSIKLETVTTDSSALNFVDYVYTYICARITFYACCIIFVTYPLDVTNFGV